MKTRPHRIGFLWIPVGCLVLVTVAVLGSLLAVDRLAVDRQGAARSSEVEPPPALRSRGSGAPAELRSRDCWMRPSDVEVECGTVDSPLAPGAPAVARLAVLRVRARETSNLPPLLFLGGGPGHPVIARLTRSLGPLLELARARDLVFVDPRGTGFSTPTLTCRQVGSLPESLQACFEAHSVEVDPSSFTTAAGVRDLEQVRRALGYRRWDVLATSYGTRWALALLRDAPESVRAVVLDSPVPLQADLVAQLASNAHRALLEVFAACTSQPACRERYPKLPEDLEQVASRLASLGSAEGDGDPDAERFVRGLLGLLYSPATAVYVPQIVHRAARGDFRLFVELERGIRTDDFSLGAHLSVQCAEEVAFTSAQAVERADAMVPRPWRTILSGRSYLEDCGVWRVRPAPPRENEPVRATAPALVLSGRLDPVTPPAYAEAIYGDLSASRLVVVRGASHGLALSPCGLRLVDAFLRAPEAPLELSCLEPEAPPPVVPPRGKIELGAPLEVRIEPPTPSDLALALDAW